MNSVNDFKLNTYKGDLIAGYDLHISGCFLCFEHMG